MKRFKLKLRFPASKIALYAAKYSYSQSDEDVFNSVAAIRQRGYLTKPELQLIAAWKTPRSKPRIAENAEDYIKEATKIALSTDNDRLRIEILTLLRGVSWPTASTILHFYHKDRFPILDFRALYSLSCEHIESTDYNYEFWRDYTNYIRDLSDKTKLDMRTVDRGLWEYSKEKQD
jgi:hypothetical protein